MGKRDEIKMTPAERLALLGDKQTMVLTTQGADGYPHAVAMWYAFDEDETVWMATFGKSQKAVNIRRDSKVALLVEEGIEYEELRGVMIRGDAEIIEDDDVSYETLCRVFERRYGELADGAREQLKLRSRKRVTIKITPRKVASWDHRKTANPY